MDRNQYRLSAGAPQNTARPRLKASDHSDTTGQANQNPHAAALNSCPVTDDAFFDPQLPGNERSTGGPFAAAPKHCKDIKIR